jgi:hypothetical protein
MRILRTYLLYLTSFTGIIAVFWLLSVITGFLMGLVTPETIVTSIATLATRIAAAKFVWWLAVLTGWPLAFWVAWKVITPRPEYPVTIREDDMGAVEVAPTAIRRLAEATVKACGGPAVQRTEFVRELGKPTVKIWCDLTSGSNGEGPLELGNRLRDDIEARLKEDFSLEGIRVNMVHRPKSGSRSASTVGHA